MTRILRNAGVLLLLVVASACDDDPFALTWDNRTDTATVYSMARPETHLPSGFNFVARRVVLIDAPTTAGRWDWTLDTQEGELVLLPPRAIGLVSTAGIIPLPGEVFDEVAEAPQDSTRYVRDLPVPVEMGTVYVVRTHQETNSFGQRCIYYGKMEPIRQNLEEGILEFIFDANPICNERALIAP